MNSVAYKTTELEVASFLKARAHRLLFARLDANVVALRPTATASGESAEILREVAGRGKEYAEFNYKSV